MKDKGMHRIEKSPTYPNARRPANIVEALQQHAVEKPSEVAFRYLDNAGNEAIVNSYSELVATCERVAASLQNQGLAGKRIIILLPNEPAFVYAYLGCVLGGAISIPIEPTRRLNTQERLEGVIRDARPAVIISNQGTLRNIFSQNSPVPCVFHGVPIIDIDSLAEKIAADQCEATWKPSEISHLQYTSGSTSKPKGVIVSHENVINNCRDIADVAGDGVQHTVVGWVPFTHDMGLVGLLCLPVLMGFPFVFMQPSTFVMRPHLWLEAITKYGGTISAAPNFAFQLCAQRISEARRRDLDLQSLVALFNGAERVDASTLTQFCQAFEACGLSANALLPCYGMAECTLMVTSRRSNTRLVVKQLDENGKLHDQHADRLSSVSLVSCGTPTGTTKVVIIKPNESEVLPSGDVGEICVHGSSVTPGYLTAHDHMQTKTHGALVCINGLQYFRTGDLGFIDNEELFVTGRQKDMIILAGRNVFPDDIEKIVEESHEGIRSGRAIAFSINVDTEEKLVVVAELANKFVQISQDELENTTRIAIAQQAQVGLHELCLVRSGELPRTLSGKKQRQQCAAMYKDVWNRSLESKLAN
ncbi:fatty acyl-AMP ligase [bacterium]|nr:fatty acyl-AMP ligase [bacterium]